jgi:hypothetical protein
MRKYRRVDEQKLRELGFSEEIIQESVRVEEAGLFDMDPSPHLVDRIMQRCIEKGVFPAKKQRATDFRALLTAIFPRR